MRRAALAVVAVGLAAACGAPTANVGSAPSSVPKPPAKPITLTVLDVSGDLLTSKPVIQRFVAANPRLVSRVQFETGAPTDVAGKVQAQQNAGRVNIDLVLSGGDGISAMQAQHELIRLLPAYSAEFPGLQQRMDPGAWKMMQAVDDDGIVATQYGAGGPLLEYNPAKVGQVPTTPQELLSWAKAHPGQFIYANPDNSGPGRVFLMGLPYMLGDSNPADPVHGWTKTWAYLKQLGQYIQFYPSSSKEALQGVADGSRSMTVSEIGIDISDRVDGTLPASTKVATFRNQSWIVDGHYAAIPKGVPAGHVAVVLDLIKYLMRPDQLAGAYDQGLITFPVKGVSVNLADAKGKQVYQQFGRPDFYPRELAAHPVQLPLSGDALQAAFDMWNREIGSAK
ncbi:MAG TPA: extracellular solute-binding protein [Pseudonocardiaceae bacterium]|nr:extracellular solute-binding protein [Pseudonocardiaceae bacterium]